MRTDALVMGGKVGILQQSGNFKWPGFLLFFRIEKWDHEQIEKCTSFVLSKGCSLSSFAFYIFIGLFYFTRFWFHT